MAFFFDYLPLPLLPPGGLIFRSGCVGQGVGRNLDSIAAFPEPMDHQILMAMQAERGVPGAVCVALRSTEWLAFLEGK